MSELLLARGQEAVELVSNFSLLKSTGEIATQLAVAAEFGPTDSGKGYHGPLAFQEVERRIAAGELPEHMLERGLGGAVLVRPFANRGLRDSELLQPEAERSYSWYCDMSDDDDWNKLVALLTADEESVLPNDDAICQLVSALGGRIYGTLIQAYGLNALNLVELTGAECWRIQKEKLFGDFSATLLFARDFSIWLRKVRLRDGPIPNDFLARLDEGWDAMTLVKTLARVAPEFKIRKAANDYGERGDVPANIQLADAYTQVEGPEQDDREGKNQEYFDTYYDDYGSFREEYRRHPRPLDEYLPRP